MCILSRLILAATLATLGHAALADGAETRQQQVARSGAAVMPFDMTRTTHFFDDNRTGGIETVTANDADDRAQVALIRSHLTTEAERFSHGDFSDPATIHGHDMPGLARLAAAGAALRIRYQQVPAGASLMYASDDAAVVEAVHAWFAAQRSDHGAHDHLRMHRR